MKQQQAWSHYTNNGASLKKLWAQSFKGIATLSSKTEASVSSSFEDEGSCNNAPDTVIRCNKLGPSPRMMAQRRKSFRATRPLCLMEIALMDFSRHATFQGALQRGPSEGSKLAGRGLQGERPRGPYRYLSLGAGHPPRLPRGLD